MNYVMLFASEMEAGDTGQDMAAWGAYFEALSAAGIFVEGKHLAPCATATTLRMHDGAVQVQDGPFADTHERLGGWAVIDVPDLDSAIAWARKCPGVLEGSVEVRPTNQTATA